MIPGRRFARPGVTRRRSVRRSLPSISRTGATPLANTIKVLDLLRVCFQPRWSCPSTQTSLLGVSCPILSLPWLNPLSTIDSRCCLTLDPLRLFMSVSSLFRSFVCPVPALLLLLDPVSNYPLGVYWKSAESPSMPNFLITFLPPYSPIWR